jgi:hypothetical protein
VRLRIELPPGAIVESTLDRRVIADGDRRVVVADRIEGTSSCSTAR